MTNEGLAALTAAARSLALAYRGLRDIYVEWAEARQSQ